MSGIDGYFPALGKEESFRGQTSVDMAVQCDPYISRRIYKGFSFVADHCTRSQQLALQLAVKLNKQSIRAFQKKIMPPLEDHLHLFFGEARRSFGT